MKWVWSGKWTVETKSGKEKTRRSVSENKGEVLPIIYINSTLIMGLAASAQLVESNDRQFIQPHIVQTSKFFWMFCFCSLYAREPLRTLETFLYIYDGDKW